MSFTQIDSQRAACCFILILALSFPPVIQAQQPSNPFSSNAYSRTSYVTMIALGGGGRGGGSARSGGSRSGRTRSGGAGISRVSSGASRSALGSRTSGKLHSSLGNRSSGRLSPVQQGNHNVQTQRPQASNRGNTQAIRTQPSQSIAGQGQRTHIEQLPTTPRLNSDSGQRPTQLPQGPGKISNRPNRARDINQINASRSVNVEGYDGGWGYQGEDYPWGLGAVAGIAGFTLGSVRNSLPANSQPVVIQGQPYYESNGMYFSPADNGNYTVVPPPEGAVEGQLPSGAKPVNINGLTLYEIQGVYYQPTIQNGKQGYMVVVP